MLDFFTKNVTMETTGTATILQGDYKMRLSYFSISVSYDGTIHGTIQFSNGNDIVTHTLNEQQTNELSVLVAQWKTSLLGEAATNLIKARDDLLALEHVSNKTGLG